MSSVLDKYIAQLTELHGNDWEAVREGLIRIAGPTAEALSVDTIKARANSILTKRTGMGKLILPSSLVESEEDSECIFAAPNFDFLDSPVKDASRWGLNEGEVPERFRSKKSEDPYMRSRKSRERVNEKEWAGHQDDDESEDEIVDSQNRPPLEWVIRHTGSSDQEPHAPLTQAVRVDDDKPTWELGTIPDPFLHPDFDVSVHLTAGQRASFVAATESRRNRIKFALRK